MADELRAGVSATLEWVVEDRHCTMRAGEPVLATPSMVWLLEDAAARVLQSYLEANQATVGSRVEVRHLAPTPKGMRVRATATVGEVDGRRVTFEVLIEDEIERVGEAFHERVIIDLDRFTERVRKKLGSAR